MDKDLLFEEDQFEYLKNKYDQDMKTHLMTDEHTMPNSRMMNDFENQVSTNLTISTLYLNPNL